MPAAVDQHHHRSTTKQSHKPYKPRFTSKGALKDKAKGKVESLERSTRKTPHQQVMSKLDRRNQAKQKRIAKDHSHALTTNVFAGKDGAPRVIAVIPLCDDLNTEVALRNLNSSIDVEEPITPVGLTQVRVERFKQRLAYMVTKKDLFAALDACRAADYVLFLLSAEEEVDELGEQILRCVEGQGVSNVYTAVQGLEKIEPAKRRPGVLSSLKSFITHFFATQEKIFSIDSRQECQNVVRSLCTTTPKGVRWREQRSWMMVEECKFAAAHSTADSATTTCVVTGVVRGRNLKADRLVQIGDWGDFQIEKVVAAPKQDSRKGKGNAMSIDQEDNEASLDVPTEDQDNLDELAPDEVAMQDVDAITAASTMASERKGVLLDDHHYYSEDEDEQDQPAPRRLPRGTSKYQAAWYLDDLSDSGSDLEDLDDDHEDMAMADVPAGPADGLEGMRPDYAETEGGPSEYPQSEAFDDVSPDDEAEKIAAYRASKRTEAEEDLLFPDEIELHPSVLARERLHKYRGLKSLRTSPWDTTEDALHQPDHWTRLLDIRDYKGAQSRVLRDSLIGGIKAGTRVSIHLRSVPKSLQDSYDTSRPLALFSLLRHEHKRTAVNYSITIDSEYPEPLRSKEELIVQCGARRFVVNPLFSQPGNTPNDVHKFERFLHPGRTAVASWIGPLTWGSVPVLVFKRESPKEDAELHDGDVDMTAAATGKGASSVTFIGTGTSLPASTSRVIAKRVILTGEPYKIHKRIVTVRYMFFNAEDIAWFKALQLWTNRGRQGQIRESLGTHGYFKASFDGKVSAQEGVGISLYKRVWPRWAKTPQESGVIV